MQDLQSRHKDDPTEPGLLISDKVSSSDTLKPENQPEMTKEVSLRPILKPVLVSRPIYVPPLNFSLVEDGIYRSGFPMPINYPFLAQLKLKTVIYLGDLERPVKDEKKTKKKKDKHGTGEIFEHYLQWIESTDVTFYHLEMHLSQEPFILSQVETRAALVQALQLMLDRQNFPMLIHLNKGKHRIGVLVGLMRKILQGWCMSGIFDEYEKFAMGKSEYDLEFIELWQPELSYDARYLPEFVRI